MAVPKSAPQAAARKAAGPSVAAGRKYSDRSDGGEEKQMVSTHVTLLHLYENILNFMSNRIAVQLNKNTWTN